MQVLNDALLVYMLDAAAPVFGRLKIQKTPFLVELGLRQHDLTASTFTFKRWHNGPFSQGVWDSLDRALRAGLVRPGYRLTDRGLFVVDVVVSLREIGDNREVFDAMTPSLRHCRTRNGTTLMREAYDLEVEPDGMPGELLTIRDIPSNVLILGEAESDLVVPDDYLSVLESEFQMSDEELERARGHMKDLDRDAIQRLLAASSSDPPS